MAGMVWNIAGWDDRTGVRVKNRILNLLHAQLTILPEAIIVKSSGELNWKAVGYIYGYVDAYLRAKCNIEHIDISVLTTSQILEEIFPIYYAENYARFLVHHINESNFKSGRIVGDHELQQYLINANSMPIGLARFILKSEEVHLAEA